MYAIEDLTENMNESGWEGEWLSVIEGMDCYNVLHDGKNAVEVYDEHMDILKKDGAETIINKAEEYLNKEQ